MISSPFQTSGFFTNPRIKPATHGETFGHTRALAIHAAESTWTGAAQMARFVGESMIVVPLAPIALVMWLSQGMQKGREVSPCNCD